MALKSGALLDIWPCGVCIICSILKTSTYFVHIQIWQKKVHDHIATFAMSHVLNTVTLVSYQKISM